MAVGAKAVPGTGRTVGEERKPRVLLAWAGPGHDRVAEVLARHAPTVRVITTFRGIRQADYDVLVTDRMTDLTSRSGTGPTTIDPDDHLFVISFVGPSAGGLPKGTGDICHGARDIRVEWRSGGESKAVEIPDDLLPAASDLVNDDLVPVALARPSHIVLQTRLTGPLVPPAVAAIQDPTPPKPDLEIHAFLWTGGPDPRLLAAWYRRSDQSEGWVLPSDVLRPWDWVAAAIQHWARTYGRFPLVGGWWADPKWQTVAEAQAVQAKVALKEELAATTARLEAEIVAATAALEGAQNDAAGGPRRLLTEKGEPLKQAVAAALTQLGYTVMDRDLVPAPDGAGKIEDLGVADRDDSTVDPIIEVKGYDRGVRAGDIGQMTRHLVRARSAGRSPSAIWWVANHSRSAPPDARPLALANEDAMIRENADDEVPLVLIDTRDLFLAVQAVELGTATPARVRASLRAARGRWEGMP